MWTFLWLPAQKYCFVFLCISFHFLKDYFKPTSDTKGKDERHPAITLTQANGVTEVLEKPSKKKKKEKKVDDDQLEKKDDKGFEELPDSTKDGLLSSCS